MNNTSKKRSRFKIINKYQGEILYLIFMPTLAICLLITLVFSTFYDDLMNVSLYASAADRFRVILHSKYVVMVSLWLFFTCALIIAYIKSHRMVGAYNRILKEMDDIIHGGERRKIALREKDGFFNEIVQRINRMIEQLPKN